jgi:hypothetical protein
MSWIRNHFRHFVIPGVRTIARADGRVLMDRDIRPFDGRLRPSSKCKYAEAGMLYAAVASVLRKSDPTREVALGLCRALGSPAEAQFIYELDSQSRVRDLAEGYKDVEGSDVLHSFIRSSVKRLKRRTRKKATVVYPGRDVWCWEVLSRKVGLPSLYDSRVSRCIATNEKALQKTMEHWEVPDWARTLLFDTGYQGTVPRAIGKAAGLERINMVMLSAVEGKEQIFPGHAKSRRKALACEYLAKYRRRCVTRDDAPYQELADLEEFIKAALLTVWLWYHVSPGRLPSWRDQPKPKPRVVKLTGNPGWGSGGGSGGNIVVSASNASTFTVPSLTFASASTATSTMSVIDPSTFQLLPSSNTSGGLGGLTATTPITGGPVLDGNGNPIFI